MTELKPTLCLLGAPFNTNNRGVSALAASTVESFLHSHPTGKVILLDYGTSPASYQVPTSNGLAVVEMCNIRFSKRLYLKNNIARLLVTAAILRLLPRRWRSGLVKKNGSLETIAGADVVASLAGGDSFSDIYGMWRFFYVSLPQLLVLVLGKPLVLLPQTLGPFRRRLAKRLAGYIMERAETVYARDRESLEFALPLVRESCASRFQSTYDMAFALPPVRPERALPVGFGPENRDRPLVGLNVSGLLWMGGYTRDNMFGLKGDYRGLICRVVKYLMEQDLRVVLVPHVYGGKAGSDSDAVASEAVMAELGSECGDRLSAIQGDYDAHELKYMIGRCDFFLGSRMHACIAALSQGVPAVGLAYSRKFKGVFDSIGVGELIADLRTSGSDEILGQIGNAFEGRAAIASRLRDAMPDVRRSVLGLFSTPRDAERLENVKAPGNVPAGRA